MICLATHKIILGPKSHPILRVECWWMVEGKGLFPNLEDALSAGDEVAPCAVAVAENDIYEVLPPVLRK